MTKIVKRMTREYACVLLDLIESATSDNWPNIRDNLEEMGYNGQEVEEATGILAELGHRSNPISARDF